MKHISDPIKKIVFVDPQDPNLPFWPGIIIEEEYNDFCKFCHQKGISPPPKPSKQLLVVYFEDLSFSICNRDEVISIETALKKFPGNFNDLYYKKALEYHKTGVLPSEFQWMKYSHLPSPQPSEREYLDPPIVRQKKLWLKMYMSSTSSSRKS